MNAKHTSTSREVFLLPLSDSGAPSVPYQYIYLPPPTNPPYILRFEIEGTSSICRQGTFCTNIPKAGGQFSRDSYQKFTLHPDFNETLKFDVPITSAGAFSFFTTYTPLPQFSTGQVTPPEPTRTPVYYVDVEPRLTLGRELLPLDALSIFSVVSRFMGRYPESWYKHFKGIAERNYNMVHFTPLVEHGESNSPFSLYDQLAFDPHTFPRGEKDIEDMVAHMSDECGLLGLTDVVWNHTANNSKWLEEHPEAGYNVDTAPWMESALELDSALLKFGEELEKFNLPTDLKSEDDISRIIAGIQEHVVKPLKLWEYYAIDVAANVDSALYAWSQDLPVALDSDALDGASNWSLRQKAAFLLEHDFKGASQLGSRFSRGPSPRHAGALLAALYGGCSRSQVKSAARQTMIQILDELNVPFYEQYNDDMKVMGQQVHDRMRYTRLDADGPHFGRIGKNSPLIETYFTRLSLNDTTKQHKPGSLALANNGWIWGANALKDHAGPDSRAYTRRELIVWSDCVKLRYGQSRSDNPYLWDFMARYTRLMAKYFVAFRIDNCHSTPIHVAEYLLDEARQVRPNLAVFAELFTGSEEMDYVFVKRLGISSLIREAMQAWSTQEMSRYVHMHAGKPIGSFELEDVHETKSSHGGTSDTLATEQIRRVQTSQLHALFMDCTHDNEMPAQKRDARDTLPNAALVSMCAAATGSVMGYDEIYPQNVNIVLDKRLYTSPSSEASVGEGSGKGGIAGVKRIFNRLHTLMGRDGYNETFIHHEGEFITIHRVHPLNRRGYFVAAHTAYPGYGDGHGSLSPVYLSGSKAKLLGCWKLGVDSSEEAKNKCREDPEFLRGLPSTVEDIQGAGIKSEGDNTVLTMPPSFPPGSVALFETWMPGAEHSDGLDTFVVAGAADAVSKLNLTELNFLLYRSDAEEGDSSSGQDGTYNIPKHGPLVYAGLQGWWSVLEPVIKENNLGHPLCEHLRDGLWAFDFIVGRLRRIAKQQDCSGLLTTADWMDERFAALKTIPNFLVPRYFALVIQAAYNAARDRCLALFESYVRNGPRFLHDLAQTSVQMTGLTKSASLYPTESVPSLAAGLPHFSVSWTRCWGRDIFIALRGLYLGTGRFEDARQHIRAFASVMKHGMVPNLLGNGESPRYNARDAVWFFLQNIQDFTKIAPSGQSLLKERVRRRFLPYDDTYFDVKDSRAFSHESSIKDIIQEAMQRHASGLSFREANAGPGLDMQMRSEGFDIEVHVDWDTGLIFGGNQFNCGTWMDKMGESEKAGSKGVPGTPRDGAAVELSGLLYSTLKWLSDMHRQGLYPHGGVKKGDSTVSYAEWAAKVKDNFERCYFVPEDPAEDSQFEVRAQVVNRRGVYKDLFRSGKEYEDYQLRPNFPIAMVVAPELFTPSRAIRALEIADEVLRGPLGMATLDPSDLNYRPYYDNSNDSSDFAVAKGRNYHQGPEWVWPTGFFLRALLKFDLKRRKTAEERTEAYQQITQRLHTCKEAIAGSFWAGLPELTNKGGEFCHDSAPTQAWSTGCLIDLFMDAKEMGDN